MSAVDVIDARPETISDLVTFSSNPNTIVIPAYQRVYQWNPSKVIDILKLSDPDNNAFGFIGTMVFVRNKDNSLSVVDGQQRLISLVLIMCALRDFIEEYIVSCDDAEVKRKLSDMRRDIQDENLLVTKSYSDDEAKPRLVFDRASYDVFSKKYLFGNNSYVSDEEASRTELNFFKNNYEQAKEYFNEKYRDSGVKKNIVSLLNIRITKLKGLVVNTIYISKPEYAGEVFESINGTGVTLKLHELVKNYIYRSVTAKNISATWDEIENNCDNKDDLIENVIKYDWQSKYEETKDFEIFRSIKTNVDEASQYLDRILRVSRIFSFYLHPNVESFKYLKLVDSRNDKNHIIKYAVTLRIIGVKQFLRLIVALDYVRDYISIADYCKLLEHIQNFQVRAKVASIGTNDIDRLYSKYGKRVQQISDGISNGTIPKNKASERIKTELFNNLQSEIRKMSPDEEFSAAFINFSRTKTSGKPFFKYLLSKLENHLQSSELIIDTKDNQITLEEIYPQEPSAGWSMVDLDSGDIYRFGNATILTGKDNGAGSNKVIGDKYPIYAKSNLILNKKLVDIINNIKAWNKEAVRKRSNELAEIAVEVWKL